MKYYYLVLFTIISDQLSKKWIDINMIQYESWNIIGSFLRFTYVKNPGIAFGISVGGYTLLLVLLSIFATIFVAYIHWTERNNHPLISNGLALILGGAIGNLIDRLSVLYVDKYEGVIDFIDIGTMNYRWYTFNLADTAVTIGMALYILHSILIVTAKQNNKNV